MIAVLGGTTTLGIVLQAIVLIPALRRAGFRYRPTFGLRGMGLRSAANAAGWTLLTTLITQLALIVTNRAASPETHSTAVAGVAAVATGLLLMILPHSLIGISLVTALFTPLTDAARQGRWSQIQTAVSSGLRNVGLFNVVATAGLVGLALPLAAVFSSSTPEAVGLAHVIAARGAGLVFVTAAYLLFRICYAYEDARTPFVTQVPECILLVLVCLGSDLVPVSWIAAVISAAWSAGSLLTFVVIARAVERRYGSLRLGPVIVSHLRMVVAAVVAGIISARLGTWLLHTCSAHGLPLRAGGLVATAGAGVVLLAIYFVGLWMLRAPELTTATAMLKRRLGR